MHPVVKSARFQLAVLTAIFFVILFTLDRTVINENRLPPSKGGKNTHVPDGGPSGCFVEALQTYMNSREHSGYSCAMSLPPWGYWGPPPAKCLAEGIGAMPPKCGSVVPCPFDLPPPPTPPPKMIDECGNPLALPPPCTPSNDTVCPPPPCTPDCIVDLAAACQADILPYSGPPYPCLAVSGMTSAQADSFIFLYIVQSAYTAAGIAFFIVYGLRIRNITKPFLKVRATATWIAISYYFISWYPHANLHELYSGGDSWDLYVIAEALFHWPMTAASAVLCWYQYDLLMMLFEVSVLKKGYKTYVKENNIRWYQNYKIQAIIATVVGYGFWLGIVYGFFPIPQGPDPGLDKWPKGLWNRCWPKPYVQFFLWTFWLVDSAVGAVAAGFLVLAVRIIRGLTDPKHRKLSIGSTISIFYNLSVSAFHSMVHGVVPPCTDNIIVIDYAIHLSLIASVCVLAYYQWLMLDVQLDPESALARGQAYRKAKGTASANTNTNSATTNASASTATNTETGSSVSVSAADSASASASVDHTEVEMEKI